MKSYITAILLISVVAFVAVIVLGYRKKMKIQNRVFSGQFLTAVGFLNSDNPIFKTGRFSRPGCYVLLVFDAPVSDGDYRCFRDIYCGQSLTLAKRARQHLTGAGNKQIFRDLKAGKAIYLTFLPCAASYMNRLEKDLIWAFDATRSYNTQKGGGKHRRNSDNWRYR